jgi:SAM-dependent methyltransferase
MSNRDTDGRVLSHYEAYPYPARDPRDEAKRLITGSPSALFELGHYVFGGARDLARPLQTLVAGGGTGDAAIMLAQQMADAGVPGTVTHLDISEPSQAVARARAKARGLANLRFERGSLLDVAALGLGPFDYIDCCGVLHHLADPDAGLAALVSVLTPDGGLGLMVYGELGRTGVYDVQDMLRTLAPAGDGDAARIETAKRLVAALPPTSRFARNPLVQDHRTGGDAGLYDLLLHARDRAYRVAELAALAAGAGLRLTALIAPYEYEPAHFLKAPALLKRLDGLDWLERAAFAELLTGNRLKHIAYAVRAQNPVALPTPDTPQTVPVLNDISVADAVRFVPAGGSMTVSGDGLKTSLPVPPLARSIVGLCDGVHDLGAIHAALRERRPDLDWPAFQRQFAALYATLNGINRLVLRRPAAGSPP